MTRRAPRRCSLTSPAAPPPPGETPATRHETCLRAPREWLYLMGKCLADERSNAASPGGRARVKATAMRRLVPAIVRPAKRLRWPVLIAWPLAVACGPSFEAIQEGDLRFAHCDRLDLDPNIPPSHRLHCWREWRRVYTYGQTRDRVEYAQRRIAEVVSGDPDPPFVLPSESSPRSGAREPSLPNPVNSSPPAIVPLAGSDSALARELPESNLGPGCRSRCEAGHAACAPGCEAQPTGCKDCDLAFNLCLDHCKAAPP